VRLGSSAEAQERYLVRGLRGGRWRLSDRPPKTDASYQTCAVMDQSDSRIGLDRQQPSHSDGTPDGAR